MAEKKQKEWLSQIIDNLKTVLNGFFPPARFTFLVLDYSGLKDAIEVFILFCEQHGVLKKVADDIEAFCVPGVSCFSSQHDQERKEAVLSGGWTGLDKTLKSMDKDLLQFVP
jgi:hypothetical protein